MIWFNIQKIENRLSARQITDKQSFDYFLATLILGMVFMNDITRNTKTELVEWLYVVLCLLITILGVNAVFKTNNARDGKDFFKRFFSIAWIIGFRLFLFVLIFDFLSGLIEQFSSEISNGIKRITDTPVFIFIRAQLPIIAYVIFYFLLVNSFRRVNKKTGSKRNNQEDSVLTIA